MPNSATERCWTVNICSASLMTGVSSSDCYESITLLNMNFKRVNLLYWLLHILYSINAHYSVFSPHCLTDWWIFCPFSFEIASGLQQHPYLSSQGKVECFSDLLSEIISFEVFTYVLLRAKRRNFPKTIANYVKDFTWFGKNC